MPGRTALVVSEPAGPDAELDDALARCGLSARHVGPAAAVAPESAAAVEVVLVSAALGLQRVALLSRRLGDRRLPVLVFAHDDAPAVEACARAGFDFIMPPYLPGLLRSRLASARERQGLVAAVEDLAAEASLRRYERDALGAAEIQAGFLPETLPQPAGWHSAVRFRPAREVGGDFYDCFEVAGGLRLGIVVADVCDKGLSAAMYMALIRGLLRYTAESAGTWRDNDPQRPGAGSPPALSIGAGPLIAAVAATNDYLLRTHRRQGYFVTLFFAVLDPTTGTLIYVNAGHNPPVLLRAAGGHDLLPVTGPALGLFTDRGFTLATTTMAPGDTLFAYTDGVIDARSPAGESFGLPRLLEVLSGSAPGDLVPAVDERLGTHVGPADQFDDITMFALHREPSPVGRAPVAPPATHPGSPAQRHRQFLDGTRGEQLPNRNVDAELPAQHGPQLGGQ